MQNGANCIMQNNANAMQIASCKSHSESDNKDAIVYANAKQNECKNTGNAKPMQNKQFASCKSNSESTTNDANAMQIAHAKSDAKQAICIECEEKETNEERKKKSNIKEIKKEENNKEKEPILKKENIYIKEKNALPTDFTPIAANGKEKEKGCAEKEKEETGDLGEAKPKPKPKPIQNNQKTENMRQNKENAPKTANLFDFKKRLEELVASDEHTKDYKQVIADWMVVRKKKGAANTLTAFNRVANQMEIARKANHCTYEDCVRMSAENSWIGFEAAWMERKYGEASISFRNAQSPDWKQVTAQNNYRDID